MPVNVLVVDDSVVIRRLVTSVLSGDPDIVVVGTAASGRIALEKVDKLAPDLITLDIEMPELNGLQTLKRLRASHPRLPVIMFSTLTERAAAATLEALALGATDYVTKPANVGSLAAAMDAVRAQLLPKIKALCPRLVGSATPSAGSPPVSTPAPRPSTEAAPPPSPVRPMPDGRRRVPAIVAIGASTGGPDALATVFASLPSLDIPIVVVQHMPPVFTRLFAQRLDRVAKFAVREAENGEPLRAGVALIAPGDHHLSLASSNGTVRAVLTQTPPVNFCRPAVDVLFSSVAEIYGDRTLAVMLTGMGHDGLRGCQALRARHAEIVAQDAATSVVWGMPGAVANAGLADRILPLTAIAPDISSTIYRGRVATAGVTG